MSEQNNAGTLGARFGNVFEQLKAGLQAPVDSVKPLTEAELDASEPQMPPWEEEVVAQEEVSFAPELMPEHVDVSHAASGRVLPDLSQQEDGYATFGVDTDADLISEEEAENIENSTPLPLVDDASVMPPQDELGPQLREPSETLSAFTVIADAHAAETAVREPTQSDSDRAAKLEQLLAYVAEENREAARARYANHTRFDIEQMLGIFNRVLGEPGLDEQLAEINRLYLEHLADPRNIAAVKYLESKGAAMLQIADEVARLINSDVVVNSLRQNEYQTIARDAIQDLGLLRKMIVELKPALQFYQPNPMKCLQPHTTAFPTPVSIKDLVNILRHANANLFSSVSRESSTIAERDNLKRDLNESQSRERKLREELRGVEGKMNKRYREVPTGVHYVCNAHASTFLASRLLPDGRNREGMRIPLHTLWWTEEIGQALRYRNKTLAINAVDAIALASRIVQRRGVEANIAGVPLTHINFATPCVHVPTRA